MKHFHSVSPFLRTDQFSSYIGNGLLLLRKSASQFTKGSKRLMSICFYFLLFWFRQNSMFFESLKSQSWRSMKLAAMHEKLFLRVISRGRRSKLASFWDRLWTLTPKFIQNLAKGIVMEIWRNRWCSVAGRHCYFWLQSTEFDTWLFEGSFETLCSPKTHHPQSCLVY